MLRLTQQLMRLCRADEVPSGGVRQIVTPSGDAEYAVYRLGDEFFCTDDNCTHGMVFLSAGEVEGDEIFCPLHGGAFNIRTGKATAQPCRIALKTYEVVQVGDELFIATP
jgi:nitrite reductase/ring-hydroxylating ferredoxin subunit